MSIGHGGVFALMCKRTTSGFLTRLWQAFRMRSVPLLLGLGSVVCLSACAPDDTPNEPSVVNAVDPYLARALSDPLMVDPDLAHRSEANAAITVGVGHALPSFKGSAEAASRARETARLALLEGGPIPDLPPAQTGPGPSALDEQYELGAVLAQLNAPAPCRADITTDFALAATMPLSASVMPHGMVRVAGRADQPQCTLRLVRYVTPASIEDVLQHHYTLMARSGFDPVRFSTPEPSLIADRRGTHLHISARTASGDLTAVDAVVWTIS